MTERHSTEHEIEVPGTPDEVWDAIATGPGISAWFVPTDVDGRPGGDVVFHLGADDARGTITGWEPPARIAYEEPWPGEEETTLATEFLVEARASGTCVVRVVSTFSAGGHDEDLDAMGAGWTAFLDNLRLYLTHFRGQRAAAVSVTGGSPAPTSEAFAQLTTALGLDGLSAGATVVRDQPPLAGTVERIGTDELLVRGDSALANLAVFEWDDRTVTAFRQTCFGPDAEADAARGEAAWSEWMVRRFPVPA